jgi:hypothetical protein
MPGPTALALNAYSGALHMDPQAQESSLDTVDSNGHLQRSLMMQDPSPSGAFNRGEVVAMYQYFVARNRVDGEPITVYGFLNIPPGCDCQILHVVRA